MGFIVIKKYFTGRINNGDCDSNFSSCDNWFGFDSGERSFFQRDSSSHLLTTFARVPFKPPVNAVRIKKKEQ
jgi:hypothetical protein